MALKDRVESGVVFYKKDDDTTHEVLNMEIFKDDEEMKKGDLTRIEKI